MKTELLYLVLTAVLTGMLWIPVVVGYVVSRGLLTPSGYKAAPTTPLPDWVNRANRAHLNAVENMLPFAAVVLVAQATGVSTAVTANCTAIYFYARAAHAVIHISGFGRFMARTVAFTVAWLAFITFAVVLLQRAA
ncbi:MAG: MAPEG family protein [Bacteriovorax sp.]|nr:MAPEG family protein [Rhizobacter sp.]